MTPGPVSTKRRLALLVGSLIFAAGCTAYSGGIASVPTPSGQSKVRAGGGPSLLYLPVYVGIEQGYFANHGLNVEAMPLASRVPALISGDVEYAMSGSDEFITAAARGQATPIVAMMQQVNSLSLHIRADLPHEHSDLGYPENLQDLKGKTIATTVRGGGGDAFLQQVFAGAGMTEGRDYTIQALNSVSNILAALEAKRVDGALLFPPYGEQAVKQGLSVSLVAEAKGQGPGSRKLAHGISVAVSPVYLQAHPDAVKQFVAGLVEAERFNRDFAKNKEKLIDIAAKYTGVTDRDVLAAAIETEASLANPVPNCDKMKVATDALIAIGTLTSGPPCDQVVATTVAPKEP